MPLLLDGRKAREFYKKALTEKVSELALDGHSAPTLAIIQVGDRLDSTTYINAKKKFAVEIGAGVRHLTFPNTANQPASQAELIETIYSLNADSSVHGIILQLPIPLSLDKDALLDAIHPTKDVDGLSSFNTKRMLEGSRGIDGISKIPATARGIRELLSFYNIELAGKKVVVVGRSALVGGPIALMCLNEKAIVTVCHSKTENIGAITKGADIVIIATGVAEYFGKEYFSQGQIVVDVGINALQAGQEGGVDKIINKKITGDVDFAAVSQIVSAITPVPGGVGQMTVLALFENLVDSCIL